MVKKNGAASKTLDVRYMGTEPTISSITSRKDINLAKALNWYNYMHDAAKAKEFLMAWMSAEKYQKSTIDTIRKTSDSSVPTTIGWIARMLSRGTKFPTENVEYVKTTIDDIVKRYSGKQRTNEQEDSDKADAAAAVQEKANQKNENLFCACETEVVDAYINGESDVSVYTFLKKYLSSIQSAQYIKTQYQPMYDEVFSDDPQVKEAYGKKLKSAQKFWKTFMDDLDRYIGNNKTKKVRKPRKQKLIPAAKIVEKLKFQKEDASLKLMSINPQDIIGAKQLWIYNTKYKKIGVINAQTVNGTQLSLGVKGTTIIHYDEETSTQKTLRKPEEFFSTFLTTGKLQHKKQFAAIKSVESKCNGRINENIILLRVNK